jgi:DamX protein
VQVRDEHFFEDDDRHRILEAIEEQAKNLSMARGSDQHRLSDWLNAAEEVMPEIRKPTVKPMSMASAPEARRSSSQIIGILLIGTLLIALAGGGGFAYTQLLAQVAQLEKEAKAMSAHVTTLETTIAELKQAAATQHSVSKQDDNAGTAGASENKSASATETEQTQQLENMLDARFKALLEHIDNKTAGAKVASVQPLPIAQTQAPTIATTAQPVIPMPTAPQAVEMQPSAAAPVADNDATGDSAWLFALPAESLVLQLGSNIKADGLENMGKKIRHHPEMAHVLAVKANGSTRYVLAYGGFSTREEAKQAADRVKQDLGVSPWIRRVADVKALLAKQ